MTALDTFDPGRIERLHRLDELSRNREQFVYASDVLAKCKPGLLPWPNNIVKAVIDRGLLFNDLPNDENDKAQYESDQAEFVEQQEAGQPVLCEALGASACRGMGCPFLVPSSVSGIKYVCSGWKFTFAQPGVAPPPVEDIRLVV
jgi:hypothetical protein